MNWYILFRQEGHIREHELQKIQIGRATINQIRLREPLEIQTIQNKMYMKWTTEFEYNGNLLHNYMQSHSSLLDILKDNFTYDYSYTYVVRFLPFYSNDQMKGQQDTSLIKVTRLFNKTLS